MNETFNFQRFWTYFKYDLKQMWRNHSKAAILIGGASAIFYILWVMFSLVFTQHWSSPGIVARLIVLLIAFTILELYQTRTYGYLTDKRAGSAWLMIPASKAEKYVSMLLMTLIVIPLLFFAVYFTLDGILSLLDPTYGQALFTGAVDAYKTLLAGLAAISNESPLQVPTSYIVVMVLVSFFCNFLYFLLCGICFKKNKIVCAIAILFGLSTVLSLLTGLVVPQFITNLHVDMDDIQAARWLTGFWNGTLIFNCLLTIGLGWGVWRRIKTIQH